MSFSPIGSVRASLSLAATRIRHAPSRTLLTWIIQAAMLFVLGNVLPGVLVEDIGSALIAAAVIAALNALVRPLIVVLTLPLTVATFGLLSLLINTAVIVLAAPLVPGMEVNGFLPAFSLAIVLTVATTIVNVVLVFDEDETFYQALADPALERRAGPCRAEAARARHRPDRRPRRADPPQRDPGRTRPADGGLGALRRARPDRVGVSAAIADLGEPGGHPARAQRRHPGVPLVREGDRAPGRVEPSRRRHGDRAAGLRRRPGSSTTRAAASATSSRATRRARPSR